MWDILRNLPDERKSIPGTAEMENEIQTTSQSRNTSLLRRLLVGGNFKWTLVRMGCTALICVVVFSVFVRPIRVKGISMEPTYRNGTILAVNRWSYRDSVPQRGDVVAIRFTGESVMLLKRIIALPGESVRITDGVVSINGSPLEEPYTSVNPSWNVKREITLEGHEFLVIGDNRTMDQDEHEFGIVTRSRIVGRLLF